MIGTTIYFEGNRDKVFGVERHPLPFLAEGQKIGLHTTMLPKTIEYNFNNTVDKIIAYKEM